MSKSTEINNQCFLKLVLAKSTTSQIRTPASDQYDPICNAPLKNNLNYAYTHFNMQDALLHPDEDTRSALVYIMTKTLENCPKIFKGFKLGDLIVRVLEYPKGGKPEGKHCDIDLYTYNAVSIDWEDKVHILDTIHTGALAKHIYNTSPTTHMFNPRGHKYSVVCFVCPHYSLNLKDGRTVGDYYKDIYYQVLA